MTPAAQLFTRGWLAFDPSPEGIGWADAARPVAEALLADPELRARWLRCGGTWFAGVNVFPNDARGAVPGQGVPPLSGPAVRFVAEVLGLSGFDWDPGQISGVLPGYPQPWEGESDAAFRFRRDRDAAHLDGLLRDAERRRSPGEVHGFILGLPLTPSAPEAAPMVVWEGSHEVMRRALAARLAGIAPAHWAAEDVTEVYTAARREVFATCRRVPVHVPPGGAYLVHRLAIHGVAPWAGAETRPRLIAYFRPDSFGADRGRWLTDP